MNPAIAPVANHEACIAGVSNAKVGMLSGTTPPSAMWADPINNNAAGGHTNKHATIAVLDAGQRKLSR